MKKRAMNEVRPAKRAMTYWLSEVTILRIDRLAELLDTKKSAVLEQALSQYYDGIMRKLHEKDKTLSKTL